MKAKQFIHELEHGTKFQLVGRPDVVMKHCGEEYQILMRSCERYGCQIIFDHIELSKLAWMKGTAYLYFENKLIGNIDIDEWEVVEE